jgi:hypothetical protein
VNDPTMTRGRFVLYLSDMNGKQKITTKVSNMTEKINSTEKFH